MAKDPDEEATPEELAAKYSTYVASFLMFSVSILGICAAFLPWWQGQAAVANVSQAIGVDSAITLWYMELTESVPISPDDPELHTVARTSNWGEWCEEEEMIRREWPAECVAIKFARAVTILTPILALFSLVGLLYGLVEPLALLAGAVFALLVAMCSGAGGICGLIIGTGGIGGPGWIIILTCLVLTVFGFVATLYAAAKAMPLEDPNAEADEKVSRFKAGAGDANQGGYVPNKRMRRSTIEREKAADIAKMLQENMRKHTEELKEQEQKGGKRERKPPVNLKQVIEWSSNHGTDESQEIPLELLEKAFRDMDTDGSGNVTVDEMIEALQECGLNASQKVVAKIIKEIDKNSSGDIDVHEFVDFFRHVEELNRFQEKTENRAQFLSIVCNCCFLAHIVIVGVLLMVFIGMDEEETGADNYSIMRNALIVFSIILGLLFLAVIAIPAVRLTLGPNMVAWRRHYDKKFKQGKKKRPGANEAQYECRLKCGFRGSLQEVQQHEKMCPARSDGQPLPQGGLRQSAWGDGPEPTTVNAAIYGSSYRVRKAQEELAKLNRDWRECPNGCGFAGTNAEVAEHEFHCLLRRRGSVASVDTAAMRAPPPPGMIGGEGAYQLEAPRDDGYYGAAGSPARPPNLNIYRE
mmetsp:Transcript_68914/g.190782  ORF Transcript_68914/g.190782 Transcript_68914/m.190782 type:complete len:639 (+) Transcript_68914:61-1977(+)